MSSAAVRAIRQGTTTTYGVLAATTVTNTGATTISGSAGGNVGLFPGTSFTGSTSVTMSGVKHIAYAAARIAQTDLVTTTTTSPEISNELPATGGTTRLLIVIGAILLMTGMVRISFGRRG